MDNKAGKRLKGKGKRLISVFSLFTFYLSLFTFSAAQTLTDATDAEVDVANLESVITLGGDITEIVYALGQENHLVAVDTSSLYPSQAEALPKVGYVRDLAAEGVLSLEPSLIIATGDAGPPEVLQQLREAGVPLFIVPTQDSLQGARAKIDSVAKIFGAQLQAEDIKWQIDLDIGEAQLYIDSETGAKPRVMFIYARGAGTLLVSGTNTSAHAMIELAGGENAITNYADYKPLTAEAAVAAAPDVLLFLSRGLESVGGTQGLAELPGLSLTPAYENERIIALDDLYLLGFTPRVGQALLDLTRELYPALKVALE
jgi:iron complex transport system substrate-binding protein